MTNPTATLPQGNLAPPATIKASSQQLGGSLFVISANAEAIKNQPLFSEALITDTAPHLNDHLTTAKGYAETWLSQYEQDVLNTLEHTIAYDTKFQNFYDTLMKLADTIDQGNNLAQFKKGLSLLAGSIGGVQADLQQTYSELTTYRQDLESDYQGLSQDVQDARSKLGGLEATKADPNPLFTADKAFADELDAGKIPGGLPQVFKDNNHPLDGSLILNEQTKGAEWAISEVTDQGENYDVYVLDLDSDQLKVYKGEQGILADLHARYKADRAAMNKDIAFIAGGAAVALTGVVVICVGVATEIPTAGVSTVLVGAGVVMVVGGVASTAYGTADYIIKSKDAEECLSKIAADEAMLAVLPHMIEQVNSLLGSIQSAEGALGNLLAGWKELANKLDALQDALKEVDPSVGIFLQDELGTAKDDWAGARTQAEIVLCNFQNRPPTVVLPFGEGDASRPTTDHPAVVEAAQPYIDICAKRLGLSTAT